MKEQQIFLGTSQFSHGLDIMKQPCIGLVEQGLRNKEKQVT